MSNGKLSGDYTFPDVDFVDTDTETIVNEMTADYELQSGRTLYPGDPIRMLIAWFAAILSQERSFMNIAAKRNLPRYAKGIYLDSLAEIFYGTVRRQADSALTALRFTLSESQAEGVVIPEGTEATADGKIFFATTEELIIPAGELSGEVEAECTIEGTDGNGYQAGQIANIVEQIAFVESVTNTTVSAGGEDIETDEELYSRLRGSYEGFSTAGTAGAYQYHAEQYNSQIADVVVRELDPGQTGVTILMEHGLPTEEEIADMQGYLSSDEIRPVTDLVIVSAPTAVTFSVELTYYGASRPEPGGKALSELVREATDIYIEWQTSKIGRRINPGKLIALIMQEGAGRVEITEPTAKELGETECAVLEGEPVLIYGGADE